uniref:Copine-3 n=1 Tax=Plectus sambesii TaxID=2011161 RepID=A0A914WI52_9BILA
MTKVELSVSANDLLDMDVFSKSDPLCVAFIKHFGSNTWHEFDRTEVIDNNLNPEFAHKFVIDYFFEERQLLKFELYDVDSNSRSLQDHDFLGSLECSLGEIVSSQKLHRPLKGPKPNSGTITICAEELQNCKEKVTFSLSARDLDKKDFFGKSDPFLAFYKANEDGTHTIVHRTEVIKNTLTPTWKPFSISVQSLCGGDYNRSILIKCIDWNRDGTEDLIGEFQTDLASLAVTSPQGSKPVFELINKKRQAKKRNYKRSGYMVVNGAKTVKVHSFLDFVAAGTQLNCSVAIDFTASNGNPTQPNSLHYIHPHQPNHYARALQAVGEIIQDYDSDKLFPVYGFGARLPPDGTISHDFCVNGDPSNPFCDGVGGVLEAYYRCLQQIQLYGPTNFAPVINRVAREALQHRDGSEYFILLILTDGVITDFPQTTEAIVNASCLPLSIIIVGIGDADFDLMRQLDGDDVRLSSNGRQAERDIVQFVPFREFMRGNSATDIQHSQARLAKEVLEEIPTQFLSYMEANRVSPGSWRQNRSASTSSATTFQSRRSSSSHAPSLAYSEAPPPYPGIR